METAHPFPEQAEHIPVDSDCAHVTGNSVRNAAELPLSSRTSGHRTALPLVMPLPDILPLDFPCIIPVTPCEEINARVKHSSKPLRNETRNTAPSPRQENISPADSAGQTPLPASVALNPQMKECRRQIIKRLVSTAKTFQYSVQREPWDALSVHRNIRQYGRMRTFWNSWPIFPERPNLPSGLWPARLDTYPEKEHGASQIPDRMHRNMTAQLKTLRRNRLSVHPWPVLPGSADGLVLPGIFLSQFSPAVAAVAGLILPLLLVLL